MDKPQFQDNQTVHYFSVTSLDFEKSYKVMDMRIAKGFSDRDLSFLLGYQPLYVRDAENPLHKKRYKPRDTNYLLQIFDCKLPDIMDGKLPDLNYKLSVIATANDSGTNTYEIYKEQPNGKNKLYRSFTELTNTQVLGRSVVPITVINFLIELLRTDFFNTPKTGLELFRVCTENLKSFVRPTIIADAIKKINKADGPKIKIGKNEMRRWVYGVE